VPPDEPELATPTAPQPPEAPHKGGPDRLDAFANALADAFSTEQPGYRWPEETAPGSGAGARLDGVAENCAQDIRDHGELHGREQLSWWQRATDAIALARDHAVQWARDTWQSFVERLRAEREPSTEGPDLER
jgi:hypothetical protein